MQTLTHNDIAQRLCIGTGKARQLMRSGDMLVIEVADYGGGKKARRVTVEEFERWLREQEQKSAPKKPENISAAVPRAAHRSTTISSTTSSTRSMWSPRKPARP